MQIDYFGMVSGCETHCANKVDHAEWYHFEMIIFLDFQGEKLIQKLLY